MDLLLPILKREQKKNGFLSEKILKSVSDETGIPISKVYGVATFYHMFHTEKQGKNIIYLCNGPSCYVNGSFNLLEFLQKHLKIKVGQTTKNNKFTLYTTSCIGCCDESPAMLLNGKPHGHLTKENVKTLLKKCKS